MTKKLVPFILLGCILSTSVLTSCSPQNNLSTPTTIVISVTDHPTQIITQTEIPPTKIPPTEIPPTPTLEPTEISYKVVVPIETMQNKNPWIPMNKAEVPGSAYLVFNLGSKVFKNKDARSAIAAATDKEAVLEMAKKYYEVDPKIATTLTPPQVLGVDLTNVVGIKYDPEKARTSLEKAGYKDGVEKPTIKLLIWVSGSRQGYRYLLAKEFAKMWEENLGVKTVITTTENPQDVMKKNDWDMYMIIWGADVVDPDNFLGELFVSGKETNLGKFESNTYDQLIKKAALGRTPAERQTLYIKAEKMLCEDYIPLVPLYSVKNFKR